ncbi:hypothetical protein SeMB42_g03089 [Synchytrium endobioticum]|uniref:Mitochondrial pyruvate carrier n=1 Tax=Synchytrium endobioticum TaxID=286115 RepID=A0A507CP11_9FUNG|nr:hypothetical protein SeLEV6574_g06387 [Synchytrium endobioticum]TPX48232.1 hypothetical protein SeMB42_g03089 [Synchytrium endobioticum]
MAAARATQPMWTRFVNHPAGPKTIHFWAPAMKWGLVIAALGDLQRPPEKLSLTQTVALAATGCIWSRYSLVITPVNYQLFSVNIFVGATGLYQLYRIWDHRRKHPDANLPAWRASATSHQNRKTYATLDYLPYYILCYV